MALAAYNRLKLFHPSNFGFLIVCRRPMYFAVFPRIFKAKIRSGSGFCLVEVREEKIITRRMTIRGITNSVDSLQCINAYVSTVPKILSFAEMFT